MNRHILQVKLTVLVDSDGEVEMVSENFYARLSELVQSEDHMIDACIDSFTLPPLSDASH
jgi:hypothetical protein